MDIRKPQTTSTEQTSSSQPQAKEETKFKAGSVPHASGRLMIPPAIQQTLTVIGQKYGLPLDLNEVALDGTLAEKVKATRKIVELAKADSKLLPEMMKLIKSLMKSELKLADFHKKLVKEAIRFNVQMDKATADIFLQMAGYQARSKKLEIRTNTRAAIKEKRTQVYANYYQNSVFGAESEIIDVEAEQLASNSRILADSKKERIAFESSQRQHLQEYVNSAFAD